MSVYIGIDEEEAPDDAGASFPNVAFWNVKELIYTKLSKEDAKAHATFIRLMNDEEIPTNELSDLLNDIKFLITKLNNDDASMILSDIQSVVKYAIENKKSIIKN